MWQCDKSFTDLQDLTRYISGLSCQCCYVAWMLRWSSRSLRFNKTPIRTELSVMLYSWNLVQITGVCCTCNISLYETDQLATSHRNMTMKRRVCLLKLSLDLYLAEFNLKKVYTISIFIGYLRFYPSNTYVWIFLFKGSAEFLVQFDFGRSACALIKRLLFN